MTPEQKWHAKYKWDNVESDKLLVLTHVSNLNDGQIASLNGTDWGIIETSFHNDRPTRQLVVKNEFGKVYRVLCDAFCPTFHPEYVFIEKI